MELAQDPLRLILMLIPPVLIFVLIVKTTFFIKEDHRGVLTRLGVFKAILGPGFHIRFPLTDKVSVIDLRTSLPAWKSFSHTELEKRLIAIAGVTKTPTSYEQKVTWTPELRKLVDGLLKIVQQETNCDLSNDQLAKIRLAEAAQIALQEIKANGKYLINLPFLAADFSGPKHFQFELDKEKLRKML